MRPSRTILAILAILLLGGAVLMLRDRVASRGPKIAIVYTQPIPPINAIINGFETRVRQDFPKATFSKRHADGRTEQRAPAVSAALAERPDLLAPITSPITMIAVEQARGAVPIVFMGVTDPVGSRVARTIDAPTIATGSSDLCPFDSLLDVVRKTIPGARVLAVPYDPTDQPGVFSRGQLKALAPKHGFSVVDAPIASADELGTIVGGLASRADVVLIAADNMMMSNPTAVVGAARQAGRPTFACDMDSIAAGAVAGVGIDYPMIGRLAGDRAVRVLKGEKPGAIPVAVLRTGQVYYNKKSACLAGLDPAGLLPGATPTDPGTTCDRSAAR